MTEVLVRAENLREGDIAVILGMSYILTQVLPGYPVDIRFKSVFSDDSSGSPIEGSLSIEPSTIVQVHRDLTNN